MAAPSLARAAAHRAMAAPLACSRRPSTTVRCRYSPSVSANRQPLVRCLQGAGMRTGRGSVDAAPGHRGAARIGLGESPSSDSSLQVQSGCRRSAIWSPLLLCSAAVIVGEEPGFIHVFPRTRNSGLPHIFSGH